MYSKEVLTGWDKQHVWHPFTQMKEYAEADPLIIDRGEGFYLVDIEGNRYIDGVSSLWVLVHGHGKKEIITAIQKQAQTLCHSTLLGIANVPSIVLAKRLSEIVPEGLTKVFYSDNGSTSVEIALKMAYQYWQQKGVKNKKRFISFTNGYHGDTIGSVSVGGIDLFHKIYSPLLFKTRKAPSPYCYRCPLKLNKSTCDMACVTEFEKVVRKYKDKVCAVVIEPGVQGAAGIIVQPDGFLSSIWKIAKDNDLLFITDEVATGFGRTGHMFACEKEDIRPDFLCVAKSITGGYLPLAATLTTDAVYQEFLGSFGEFKAFFHGHTYTGNPIACAAAIENLVLYESENLIDKIIFNSQLLRDGLKRFHKLTHVGDIRQSGFMVGIELVEDKKTKRSYASEEKIGQKVVYEARKRGAVIRPLGDVVVLMPPLAIDETTLMTLLDITYESIKIISGE